MLQLLVAPEAVFFTAALVLMTAIGVIEALGFGTGAFDLDWDAGVLDWLGVGHVPVSILLVAFLAIFGSLGLAGQQVALATSGSFLTPWLAVPAAVLAALPVSGLVARLFARVMPRDETTAIGIDDLIGLAGTITVGRAAAGSPARTRVVDPHGQPHHVLVEPNDPASAFEEGDTVLLVRREGQRFRAILHSSPRFDWIDP